MPIRIICVVLASCALSTTASAETPEQALELGRTLLHLAQPHLTAYLDRTDAAPVPQPPERLLATAQDALDQAQPSLLRQHQPVVSISPSLGSRGRGPFKLGLHGEGSVARVQVLHLSVTADETRLWAPHNEREWQLRLPQSEGWIGARAQGLDASETNCNAQALRIGGTADGRETYWLRRPYNPSIANTGPLHDRVAASITVRNTPHQLVVIRRAPGEQPEQPMPVQSVQVLPLEATELATLERALRGKAMYGPRGVRALLGRAGKARGKRNQPLGRPIPRTPSLRNSLNPGGPRV